MLDTEGNRREGGLECVSFTVCGQVYCLNIMMIREIRRWASVTTLPHADAHVLGVINLRGNVIPVFDLAVHFGLGRTEPGPRNVVIIADVEGATSGLLVESVSEILTVDPIDIQDPPRFEKDGHSSLIEGVISVGEEMAQLIDLRHLSHARGDAAA
ncbi:chemotaxis protein CheW [Yoonia sp. BS5-3]|uniref:Chemotaxis protein CheW n=1 Tax=Yoonia phaeophyticola TaxID=3137369 RepID=A0ABZ2V3Q1_9RHOB